MLSSAVPMRPVQTEMVAAPVSRERMVYAGKGKVSVSAGPGKEREMNEGNNLEG